MILPWIRARGGGEILDIGAGTGLVAAEQARRDRRCTVVAVDRAPEILAVARRRYGSRPNLHFRQGAADQVHSADATSVVLSSVLHEVYSYAGGSLEAVERVLKAVRQSLNDGGRLIIREFIRPPRHQKRVILHHRRDYTIDGHDFASFSRDFPYPTTMEVIFAGNSSVMYLTDIGSAYEFLLRKDYHEMWNHELQERYGIWTQQEAEAMVQAAGFQILHSRALSHTWISAINLRSKIKLLDPESLRPLNLGACQLLLVAEKSSARAC